MKLISLILVVAAWAAEANEIPAADCKYLLMSPDAVRESVQSMIQQPAPAARNEREQLAIELRVAANVLLAHATFSDPDVKKAFQAARELVSSQSAISNLYPLTVGKDPIAQFKTRDLAPLNHRFSQLILSAYPVYRSQNMEKPVAYITKITLDVGEKDLQLFEQLFDERAFLHESISASLKNHREDLINIGAALLRPQSGPERSPGRMKAVVISPVITDAFAYTHTEFRKLNRDHRDFISFFEEMKRYPDEVIYEILQMIGSMTDRSQFEN